MTRPLDIPQGLGTAFTLTDAQRYGISAMQLARAGLARPVYGIYLRATQSQEVLHPIAAREAAHVATARALAPKLASHFCFSHETAALLWNLPVPSNRLQEIRVVSLNDRFRVKRRGVWCGVTTADLAEVTTVRAVRVTSPSATWAMLAPKLSRRDAIALGDAILHRPRIGGTRRFERDPLATFRDLEAAIGMPRRRHRGTLVQLAQELTPCSASAPESHLRVLLSDMGFVPEALDYDVLDEHGRFVGSTEIAYPSRKVLFEYEGDHHRIDKHQWNRDIQKYTAYTSLGWRVVRVTAELLYRRPGELRVQVARTFER